MPNESKPTDRFAMLAVSRRILPVALVITLLMFVAQADRPAAPPMSVPAIPPVHTLYDRAMPAIVEILVNDHLNGSGWIADKDGHVMTAAHVVMGENRRLEVLTKDQGRLEAKLIAVDLGRDLALLRLPDREGGYPFLPNARKSPLAGSDIYLFGSPIYRHGVMLKGTVARNGTTFEYLPSQRSHIETIHVTGDTPRGTSGGAWLNEQGEVVGLQSGMMHDQNKQVGISFMIPIEPIQFLINTKASPVTPTIGAAVEEVWEQSQEFLGKLPRGTEGIVVRQPDREGAAAVAGLRESDVILSVNDQPMRWRDQFLRMLRSAPLGEEWKLKVLRDGSATPLMFTVKIGQMKAK